MKKSLSICLAIVLLLSFAACTAAPTVETPAPTLEVTPEPIPSPTPEPTPTPEPELSEGQKMYFKWIKSRSTRSGAAGDIYANLLAVEAYNNGELNELIETGDITEEDIQIMLNWYDSWVDGYSINIESVIHGKHSEDMHPMNYAFNIIKGEKIFLDDGFFTTHDIDVPGCFATIERQLNNALCNGESLLFAFPEESQERIEYMMGLYKRIHIEEVIAEFHDKLNSGYLNPVERYYLASDIFFFDSYNSFFNDKNVIYEGEEMSFFDYNIKTQFYGNSVIEFYYYINQNHYSEPKLDEWPGEWILQS